VNIRIDPNLLEHDWVHAHEEDSAGAKVYRPRGYEFQPSRGRGSMQFLPDGTCIVGHSGPTDKPEQTSFRWKLSDDLLIVENDDGEQHRFAIEEIDESRLVLSEKE
jgi:hypothetical protein